MPPLLCDSSLLKHLPSSSFPPSSFLSSKDGFIRKKPHLGFSFLGSKFVPKHNFGGRTSKSWNYNGKERKPHVLPSLGGLLGGIFKGTDTGESTRQQYSATVSLINGMEPKMSALIDSELRDMTSSLKERA